MSECLAASGCITCGDEALSMMVLDVDRKRDLALCADATGRRSSVEIALVDPVMPGEVLLVHAGTALGRVADEAPAEEAATGEGPAEEGSTEEASSEDARPRASATRSGAPS
jgi:hydrogenase maturation factor